MRFSPRNSKTPRQPPFFRTQPKFYCSAVLCAKPCRKRLLLSPEKSSEGTLYSVPSFGGHIAISHDVTVYPFLAMARTTSFPGSLFSASLGRGTRLWPGLQSRAQSSPAPRSAVGRREELWGHGILTAEIVRFRFLCACLGLMKRKSSRSQLQPVSDSAIICSAII